MDILYIRKTERKNEYILTLQDQLIKFCVGIPLPDQIIEIAKAEEDLLIGSSIYWEHQILIDQGRNFISELMKKVAKLFRIRKFRTTAFHPQSNGSFSS